MPDIEHVWIFHGQGAQFASEVFASEADGLARFGPGLHHVHVRDGVAD